MTKMQTTRWLGIEWIGTPFPKRLRVRSVFPSLEVPRVVQCPVFVQPMPRCGCMARPKRAILRLVDWLNEKFPYEKGSES